MYRCIVTLMLAHLSLVAVASSGNSTSVATTEKRKFCENLIASADLAMGYKRYPQASHFSRLFLNDGECLLLFAEKIPGMEHVFEIASIEIGLSDLFFRTRELKAPLSMEFDAIAFNADMVEGEIHDAKTLSQDEKNTLLKEIKIIRDDLKKIESHVSSPYGMYVVIGISFITIVSTAILVQGGYQVFQIGVNANAVTLTWCGRLVVSALRLAGADMRMFDIMMGPDPGAMTDPEVYSLHTGCALCTKSHY